MSIARRSSFLFRVVVLAGASVVGLSGCTRTDRETPSTDVAPPSAEAGGPVPNEPTQGESSRPLPANLQAEIEAGGGSEADPIPITIRVTNTGADSLILELLGREVVFDLLVADETGRVIWSRLDDNPQPAIVRFVILEPGDDLELNDLWDRRSTEGEIVPPGIYRLSGVIPTSTGPFSVGPIALSVDARP